MCSTESSRVIHTASHTQCEQGYASFDRDILPANTCTGDEVTLHRILLAAFRHNINMLHGVTNNKGGRTWVTHLVNCVSLPQCAQHAYTHPHLFSNRNNTVINFTCAVLLEVRPIHSLHQHKATLCRSEKVPHDTSNVSPSCQGYLLSVRWSAGTGHAITTTLNWYGGLEL